MEIFIKTTNRCNLLCPHCLDNKNKNGHDIEYNIDKLISWLPKNSNVCLFGGEPLLNINDKLLNLIKIRNDCTYRITSNLSLSLNEECKHVLQLMNIITTSFDIGIRFNNTNQLIQWINNIRWCKQNTNAKLRLNICLTNILLSRRNIVRDLIRLLNQLDFDEVFFSRIINEPDLSPISEQLDSFMIEFDKAVHNTIINCSYENIQAAKNNIEYETPLCSSSSITIHPNGHITTCSQFDADQSELTIDNNFETALQKRKLCQPNNICFLCEHFDECEKSCPLENWSNGCPYYKEFAYDYIR